MTTEEFSNGFDTLVDSYRRFKKFDDKAIYDSIEFNEYEKSLFLTMAQDEVLIGYYSGKNTASEAFEHNEEVRRYLDSIVKSHQCVKAGTPNAIAVSKNSAFFLLPNDIAFIVYEQANISGDELGCLDGSMTAVYPVTHDEYNRIRKNPFRGPTKRRVLRLDVSDNVVELISNYTIGNYLIRYVAKLEPIILEDLSSEGLSIKGKSAVTNCSLDDMLHDTILKRAVQMALASKGINTNN